MDQSTQPMPGHPATFDEVVARGFPHTHLQVLQRAHEARVAARPAAVSAPRLAAAPAPAARKDAGSGFGAEEQAAFKGAVERLVAEGKYQELVGFHMDMRHNMHGSMGEVGLYRFLAWHRRYLVAFERELQRVDAILRPSATARLGIPYWRWEDPIPDWIQGFLPANDPQTGQAPPPRKEKAPPPKADANDIQIIVNQFNIQQTGIAGENAYTQFTFGLEGWGRRPDGSPLPAHNQGHAWIGGIMNNTSTSPTDPMFWLHHAEIDRLWQIWRQSNPTPAPPLNGADRTMDPWSETYDELLDIGTLGYSYDTLTA